LEKQVSGQKCLRGGRVGVMFLGGGGDGIGAGGRMGAEAPWHGGGVLGGEPGRRG